MSQKNREGKRTAREAMHEQREKDKARDKRKRTLMVGGAAVVVLAIAGVAAALVANHKSEPAKPVAIPKGATGGDKLVIPTGAADAPSTLTVYEDFRCPGCGMFEKTFRDTVHSLEDTGRLKADYHLVTIIDGNLGGTGSLNAGNAAACAQDAGKFRAFHDVLYANQPDERQDKFGDKKYLLQLADKVPGLKTDVFTGCVTNGTYDGWIKKSAAAFSSSGFSSTPTILLNGKSVYGDQANPLTPETLKQQVAAAGKGKKPGTVTPAPTP
ncbi:thioredoxin domain-containing protein [Streptomyces sp. H10-C2]|uniref:DsbA family protein n=1 Tax=unclassified Streptomyces TaxID=2593676 RepID=UPI0024B9198B|nr:MULTISPECIES: thioredoxin domain-containing protein [unclassified Streptomyces]MDJ0344503.1 thioredoxin domain-containing protein [Streptomyces sp. PH10-H1]MDJ0369623.1 thioredoxin domain-containing protein [Streptomyces sp. H10-C2]